MAVTDEKSTTMYTYLGTSEDGTAYTKLIPIKSFPDLGGEPDQVECTSLDDAQQTFLLGVKTMASMPFDCNYVPADYEKVKALCDGTIRKFCVAFGDNGERGIFTWEGQISCWVAGGGVNAVREMKIAISAATEITKSESATFTIA